MLGLQGSIPGLKMQIYSGPKCTQTTWKTKDSCDFVVPFGPGLSGPAGPHDFGRVGVAAAQPGEAFSKRAPALSICHGRETFGRAGTGCPERDAGIVGR